MFYKSLKHANHALFLSVSKYCLQIAWWTLSTILIPEKVREYHMMSLQHQEGSLLLLLDSLGFTMNATNHHRAKWGQTRLKEFLSIYSPINHRIYEWTSNPADHRKHRAHLKCHHHFHQWKESISFHSQTSSIHHYPNNPKQLFPTYFAHIGNTNGLHYCYNMIRTIHISDSWKMQGDRWISNSLTKKALLLELSTLAWWNSMLRFVLHIFFRVWQFVRMDMLFHP